MLLSIITATYNSAATIRQTLASVQAQTYPHIEHWVMDGGSTDDTLSIVQHEFPHVHIVQEQDKGFYDAINKGIQRATGEIICILNSDDFYAHPRVLEQVANHFQQSQADAVYGDLLYVAFNSTQQIVRKWISGNYKRNSFLYGWMPPHPSFFVHRRCYEQWGGFRLELGSAADYELMLRFLYKHEANVVYLPEVCVHMRTGGMSNSSWKNRLLANHNDRKAWKVNELNPYWFTLYLKPLRKIKQFIVR